MSLWGKFVRKAGAADPAPVAAASPLPVSSAAKAEESIMSTSPVVTQPTVIAKAPVKQSWIKRLGSLFLHGAEKAIEIVEKDAAPIENAALAVGTLAGVGAQVQAAENTFNEAFSEVVQVEQVATAVGASTGTGPQKLAAAVPQIEQIILSNSLFKGKTIIDLDKWNKAIAAFGGAIYDLSNSVAAPVAAADTDAAKV